MKHILNVLLDTRWRKILQNDPYANLFIDIFISYLLANVYDTDEIRVVQALNKKKTL